MLLLLEENFSRLKISVPETCIDLQAQLWSSQQGLIEDGDTHTDPSGSGSPANDIMIEESEPIHVDAEEASYQELDRILRDLLNKAKKSKMMDLQTTLDITILSDYNLLHENLHHQGIKQASAIQ